MADEPTLLVLGGTEFVGRAAAVEALSRGWSVTVFNRGTKSSPMGARALRGDRTEEDGLRALAEDHTSYDAVVDTWSGDPKAVEAAGRLLEPRTERFIYVSSRSVYAFPPAAGADETSPTVESGEEEPHPYAVAKLGGERAAMQVFDERAVALRAGLILGPHENVGRLNWWLHRFDQGGVVPVPGPPELTLQYVDARDLAAFALDGVDNELSGVFDIVCPPHQVTMSELFEACLQATGGRASLRWVSPEAVEQAEVSQWSELPVWLTPGPIHDGMHGSNVDRAVQAGLRCRPLADTVADTWAWLSGLDDQTVALRDGVGLTQEAEARLLAAAEGRGNA